MKEQVVLQIYRSLFVVLILTGGIMNITAEQLSKDDCKPDSAAIVLVAFGSTSPSTVKTYEKIEQSFKKSFPENCVTWAFTSEIVIKKLRESGKKIPNVNEAIKELVANGHTSIVLQSLHIMPGEEYLSITAQDSIAKIIIGEPLLASDNDIQAVAQILVPLCKGDTPTVIAAHGNSKFPELNKPLCTLAALVNNKCSNSVLCTVEGPPGIEPMQKITAIAKNLNSVHFIPLLLIAGVHVQDDLTGEDSSSWKNIIGVSDVKVLPPLGELSQIHNIFISHCRKALAQLGKK